MARVVQSNWKREERNKEIFNGERKKCVSAFFLYEYVRAVFIVRVMKVSVCGVCCVCSDPL